MFDYLDVLALGLKIIMGVLLIIFGLTNIGIVNKKKFRKQIINN